MKSVLLVFSGFLVIDRAQAGMGHHCPVVPLEVQIEEDLIMSMMIQRIGLMITMVRK